jgi:hypothetical protein
MTIKRRSFSNVSLLCIKRMVSCLGISLEIVSAIVKYGTLRCRNWFGKARLALRVQMRPLKRKTTVVDKKMDKQPVQFSSQEPCDQNIIDVENSDDDTIHAPSVLLRPLFPTVT